MNRGSNALHQTMLRALQDKTLFNQVQAYAYEYLDEIRDRHVFPSDEALANLGKFDESMPDEIADAKSVLELLHTHGSPATVAIAGGRYFGFVNGGAVPVATAAKTLATYWDQNTAMHVVSPIAAKLEKVCEQWLNDVLGLPKRTVAGFVSGSSMANFCGLAAARFRLLQRQDWDISERGLNGAPPIRIVLGRQAHSTILKALTLLGFGRNQLEWVDTDDQGRMLADKLPPLDNRTLVIIQAGNVNSGSFDPINAITTKARAANAWVHLDGAFGLWAAACASLKHLTFGLEKANSWAVDGHKTLNTPYDCGIVLCEDKEAIVSALHMSGSYIMLSESSRDGMFYTPEMSRRARVVELWATMKFLGRLGIDQMVFTLHERALQFAEGIKKINGFAVLNEVVFNQVLVQCETDAITTQTMAQIQAMRECWVGGSQWHGRKVIRVSICSWVTTTEDIERSVHSFEKALLDNVNQEETAY